MSINDADKCEKEGKSDCDFNLSSKCFVLFEIFAGGTMMRLKIHGAVHHGVNTC